MVTTIQSYAHRQQRPGNGSTPRIVRADQFGQVGLNVLRIDHYISAHIEATSSHQHARLRKSKWHHLVIVFVE
jgi:hypothetical protein